METKFNFNSQICTTREQSERLLLLGLKKETADMCYKVTTHDFKGKEINEKIRHYNLFCWYDESSLVCGLERKETIPAWSLHRLWELLGKIKKYEGEDELSYPRISLEEDDVIFVSPKSFWARRNYLSPKGVYENIINCLEELIEAGYFNKEYLV